MISNTAAESHSNLGSLETIVEIMIICGGKRPIPNFNLIESDGIVCGSDGQGRFRIMSCTVKYGHPVAIVGCFGRTRNTILKVGR